MDVYCPGGRSPLRWRCHTFIEWSHVILLPIWSIYCLSFAQLYIVYFKGVMWKCLPAALLQSLPWLQSRDNQALLKDKKIITTNAGEAWQESNPQCYEFPIEFMFTHWGIHNCCPFQGYMQSPWDPRHKSSQKVAHCPTVLLLILGLSKVDWYFQGKIVQNGKKPFERKTRTKAKESKQIQKKSTEAFPLWNNFFSHHQSIS